MKRKVCMFVWNHFTNDARVLREATALAEKGYELDLIALHDPLDNNLKKVEEINGFTVKRVDRFPKLYLKARGALASIRSLLKDWKRNILPLSLMLLLGVLLSPLLIPLLVIGFLLKIVGVLKLFTRATVFLKMVSQGLKKDYDVYHCHDLNTLPQGYICNIFRKKKLIYDSHEVQTSRTGYVGKQYYYLEKYLVKKIDKMVMTTNTRADFTADLYKIEKPVVIHNYPFYKKPPKGTVNLYQILDIPEDEPILLYQGGIQQGRGLEQIVEAVPYFKRGITVFIGDGKIKESLVRKCKELNIESKVRFLPKVPVNDLIFYTQNAYLGFQVLQNICFNHYSTLSNKLFEYIMAEVPMVASNFPEIVRIVNDSELGVVVDPHKVEEIAEAVNQLLDNPELRDKYSANCRFASEKYNWTNEQNVLLNMYQDLLT